MLRGKSRIALRPFRKITGRMVSSCRFQRIPWAKCNGVYHPDATVVRTREWFRTAVRDAAQR